VLSYQVISDYSVYDSYISILHELISKSRGWCIPEWY